MFQDVVGKGQVIRAAGGSTIFKTALPTVGEQRIGCDTRIRINSVQTAKASLKSRETPGKPTPAAYIQHPPIELRAAGEQFQKAALKTATVGTQLMPRLRISKFKYSGFHI